MKYIYHHLGLGDHIICNGMVRLFYERYGKIKLFSKNGNLENVKFMFSDLSNLELIPVNNDYDVESYIIKNNIQNDLIKIGFSEMRRHQPPHTFDQAFYKIAQMDFNTRFDYFKVPRNYEAENSVYNELNPTNEPYIFVHDDKNRGFEIDKSKIDSKLKIIENDIKYGLFDMLKIIENAEEVHVMQSSIKDLINSYAFTKPKFFLHLYVRGYDDDADSVGLNKFNKIK
jgi:hypothetical protein